MGCGPCDPKRIEFPWSTDYDLGGNVISRKTKPLLVSACCRAGVFLWDNAKDEEIEVGREPRPYSV